jgi:aquaporin Z
MRNALCLEAFGTFFLCLAAAVAGEPLAVAAVLGALIYAGGPISGAHYNPAATLAWCVRGRHRWLPGVAYVLVQLTAALAAAAVAGLLAGHDPERTAAAARAIDDPVFEGVVPEGLAEFLGTYLIAFVILMVATSRRTAGNGYAGVAIALAVFGAAVVFARQEPTFNPAVMLAASFRDVFAAFTAEGETFKALRTELAFVAKFTPRYLLLAVLQLAGAAAAAFTFRGLFPEER